MPLAVMPRIEPLDLARVELPADHPAADLGRSAPVHGFSSSTQTGQFWSTLAFQVPLAHSTPKVLVRALSEARKAPISTGSLPNARCEGGPNVSASKVVDLRKRRIERLAVDLGPPAGVEDIPRRRRR